MLTRMMRELRFGLGWRMALYMADGEPLSVLELDQNLADVEKPPEVPPGKYEAEVQEVQEAVSAGKGNRYYAIKFVIPQDNLPADIREHYEDGATLSYNRVLVPKQGDRRQLYNVRKLIEALGFDSNTTTIDPNEWMGRRTMLRVVHEKFEGEPRANIRGLEPAEAPARTSTTPTKAAPAAGRSARARK